jgi:hypothetical protein
MALIGQHDQQQILGMVEQVGEMEDAIALLRPPIAGGQQSRQPTPAMACRRIGDDVRRRIGEHQSCADDQPEIDFLQGSSGFVTRLIKRHPGARHPNDAVAVGDADPGHAQLQRAADHVRRMRSAAEEAVIGRGDELSELRLLPPRSGGRRTMRSMVEG